ncbi:TetR/AcrR family transcriptional regulator [Agromyces endophyticus]|uniref:TetR/AcrR family transcriptional regulator n=1 Tax=Agromyces sp. H17E-10 TaxID=2932244 RepID=UPI001FD3BECA|nr:TetR/AcrR family transcriptional regulator [Agromyces sp. H17E-10]UOQ90295.1 TetR/AcrR family transcriptional regulator [Agromyces sp. H17E-10]
MGDGPGRREQIIAIARRQIASRGYSSTTVRDIADEAGILSGSLYHHFASKEAVLQEILRTFMDETLAQFERIVASSAGYRSHLDQLIEHAFLTIAERPDDVRIYQNETGFLMTQPGFEFLVDGAARIEELWLDQIIAGQRDGVFRDTVDPRLAFRFIRDAVWSTVFWYRPGGSHTAASVSENYLELLHSGLLAD